VAANIANIGAVGIEVNADIAAIGLLRRGVQIVGTVVAPG
jgi:hypothetical protein